MTCAACLLDAVRVALDAGRAVMAVYGSDFDVETKSDDSPLTLADKKSHRIIMDGLAHWAIPFISEEGRAIPYEQRRTWRRVWVVDPLDGTKEFVKRNGEFTINIALVVEQQPVAGVVYAPAAACLYFASREIGAYKIAMDRLADVPRNFQMETLLAAAQKLPDRSRRPRVYTIVASRSHASPALNDFVARKRAEKGAVEFVQAGSALKICLVAEGAADIYPRLGPTMEWDTAAGQVVAEGAGAAVCAYEGGQPLIYNKSDLLNPWFVVARSGF